MPNFLTRFDGSGRPPRPIQREALEWLADNWDKANVFGINGPTGIGKQAIGRAVQLQTLGAFITPSNILIDQGRATYPDANFLKGRAHYECSEGKATCDDMKQLGRPPCKGCPYNRARKQAMAGVPTFYNPISYYYLAIDKRFSRPRVVVVDEAHRLSEMALLLSGVQFRKGHYNYPSIENELQAIEWMTEQVGKYQRLIEAYKRHGNVGKAAQATREVEKIEEALTGLRDEPQNYAIYTANATYRGKMDEYLNVMPLDPPRHIMNRILGCEKLVLMSATLLRSDVQALARGSPWLYLDLPSPIPASQRQVLFRPPNIALDWQTPPSVIADWIKAQLTEFPGRNTLVHVSYELSRKLRPYFPGAFVNEPETKEMVLNQFKSRGGLWLASGCAEGIDLPGDECRLNLIPVLTRQNVGDPMVKKRLARPGGRLAYDMDTLKTVIQQCGRSTRGESDESIAVIGDSRFAQLISRHKKHVPQSFLEAIVWRKGET